MVFSSITFLIYFLPLFLFGYYLLPNKLKNYWIVLVSLLFYSWGAPRFLPVVVVSCLIDYLLALNFHKKNGRALLALAVVMNVLLLVYFKYANFFVDTINNVLQSVGGSTLHWTKVILPIGISFLTFQKISYLVDVYRKHCEPQRKFSDFLLFIILFPHSIAGPIVRYKELSNQLVNRFYAFTADNIYLGLLQFIIGLSKKVLIANTMGAQANLVFAVDASNLSFTTSWIGIISYTFQIYFDFSGYSDMAIGLGKMMGFRIPDNFNFPYSSRSITEFWRRWHITLSSWMKDYLYIPLGGNKKGSFRTYCNLLIVFLLSGFWHGASWNFVVWGAFHGSFLIIEKLLSPVTSKQLPSLIKKVSSLVYAFITVMVGWVFFRLEHFTDAIHFIGKLFSFSAIDVKALAALNSRYVFMLIIAFVFSFQTQRAQVWLSSITVEQPTQRLWFYARNITLVFLFLMCLGEIYATGFNPFIYFKF